MFLCFFMMYKEMSCKLGFSKFLEKRIYLLSAGATLSTTGIECPEDVPGTGVRNLSLLEALLELSHGTRNVLTL